MTCTVGELLTAGGALYVVASLGVLVGVFLAGLCQMAHDDDEADELARRTWTR